MKDQVRPSFLEHLLARESGIQPERFNWYVDNLDRRVLRYPQVATAGVPLRHKRTGEFVVEVLTVREYFKTLGVDHLFCSRDPQCLVAMQYAAINPLGFVGYQFGEKILIEHGYYRAARRQSSSEQWYDSYYVGMAHCWAAAKTDGLVQLSGGQLVIATSHNYWRGLFLGKHNVLCFDDLRKEVAQEMIIKDIMTATERTLEHALQLRGIGYPHDLPLRKSVVLMDGLPPVVLRCTRAGLLACAHLCGVQAVLDFLDDCTVSVDEFGTSLIDYLLEFAEDSVSGLMGYD